MPSGSWTRRLLTFFLPAVAALSVAEAQDRGSLEIITVPDSAEVRLDGAPTETDKTPYRNEKMLAGTHQIALWPADPAQMPIHRTVTIAPSQPTSLAETFEYRTKAFDAEHLSLRPWKLEGEIAYAFQQNLSASSGEPSSVQRLPLALRLGLPYGLEAHLKLPLASAAISENTSSGIGLSDLTAGLKKTIPAWDIALDLTWNAGNASREHGGEGFRGLQVSLIGAHAWKPIDLFGQLSYRKSISRSDSTDFDDGAMAKLRLGHLLGEQFLPFLEVGVTGRFAGDSMAHNPNRASCDVSIAPGIIWQTTPNLALELGIPIGVGGSNTSRHWGVNLSIAGGISLAKKSTKAVTHGATSVYQTGQGSWARDRHILFAGRETTNAQYRDFCQATNHALPKDPEIPDMPGYAVDTSYANYPVVNVSLEDARAYARWKGGRLPTMAEWTREFSGMAISGSLIACGTGAPESEATRPQGSGFHHVLGNVAEWIEAESSKGGQATVAGGHYGESLERCQDLAHPFENIPPTASRFVGFRIVTDVR